MALVRIVLITALAAAAAPAQTEADRHIREAGVCARCHVISVIEWGMSRHARAATDCIACHGASEGHVIDERNNVKPDKMPRTSQAVAGLCAGCHSEGCPKTKHRAGCETCHHVHALVDPKRPASTEDPAASALAARLEQAARQVAEGDRLSKVGDWAGARDAFRAALRLHPRDRAAVEGLSRAERRMNPAMPGFESHGAEWDPDSGLPRSVRVAGIGLEMTLVPGGEVELGSERFPVSKPAHSVTTDPFYLGAREVTEAEWKAVMGTARDASRAPGMPVAGISWRDAQEFVSRLNAKVPGGSFRLPTEAEWERAAGFGAPSADTACFDVKAPEPAGSRKPNRLGIFDLYGNMWEWSSSLYAPYPFDATDGRESPGAAGLRVLRGGAYNSTEDMLHPALRHSDRPERRLPWYGLRVARSIPR